MRIAINGLLIDQYAAGIGQYGAEIIRELEKCKDYDVTFFLQEGISSEGRVVYTKKYTRSYQRILDEQIHLLGAYKDFDLIHCIDYSGPVLLEKVPILVTVHDLSYYRHPETFAFGSRITKQILAPMSMKRASIIIADSENTKCDIIESFPTSYDKIRVVYPGGPRYSRIEDHEKVDALKRKLNIQSKYILYMGTLEPRKNLIRLVEAYHQLVKRGVSEQLVIAGKKGWLYEQIFRRVKDLGLEERVSFVGYVSEEDKPVLYSGAEVFIYPSLYEGFGLPPLEAMSCGVPVVVSDISSIPEVVGSAGIYVDPYDVESIGEGIYRVLKDQELGRILVHQGMEQRKKFSWGKTAGEILQIYKEILG